MAGLPNFLPLTSVPLIKVNKKGWLLCIDVKLVIMVSEHLWCSAILKKERKKKKEKKGQKEGGFKKIVYKNG